MLSLCADTMSKKFSLLAASIAACSALLLVGCDSSQQGDSTDAASTKATNTPAAQPDLSVFAGCYTVSHDEPAQIKVSEQDGKWVMQMKEPAGATRVWDVPEPLEVMTAKEVPTYFSIDPNNVDAIIGRPDRVLVMAHVKSVYANLDPLLDSEYLSYIYKGANTIYRVECDEVKTDDLANPHSAMPHKKNATTEL